MLVPFASAIAAAATTLQVEASTGLPGFHRDDLQRYLALHMAEARLGEWRFEPAADNGSAANRVEWTFKLNPYAGGEVRNFVHTQVYEQRLGVHRPITIEARLYLNGEYQTLVESKRSSTAVPTIPSLPRQSRAPHKISSALRELTTPSTSGCAGVICDRSPIAPATPRGAQPLAHDRSSALAAYSGPCSSARAGSLARNSVD